MLIILLHSSCVVYSVIFKPWANSIPFYNLCGETRMINAIIETNIGQCYILIKQNQKKLLPYFTSELFCFILMCIRRLGVHLLEKVDAFISNKLSFR